MMKKRWLTIITGIFFLTACAPLQSSGAITSPTALSPLPTSTVMVVPTPTNAELPTTVGPSPTSTHIQVDLTPAQLAAINALAKSHNRQTSQIQVVSTDATSWENGCLGVVIPGVLCTRGPIDGFKILLQANGEQFEFHTNQDGSSIVAATDMLGSLQFAVYTVNKTVEIVKLSPPTAAPANPTFTNFLPSGGAIGNTTYVLDFTNKPQVLAVTSSGAQPISFIENPNYGLAIWKGGSGTQPLLAWGTQPTGSDHSSSIIISAPDGTGKTTLVTEVAKSYQPFQLVAQRWSADGKSLYFSKEPYGIGGYILFAGASSLYQVDIATRQIKEVIPFNPSGGSMVCLGALSSDYQYVADHCSQNEITVRDLSSGAKTVINPPAELKDFRVLGSEQFSPGGKRVAYALAKGDPNAEQGWVAISDSLEGSSKLIFTGKPGEYFIVNGWLDDSTLLIQSNSLNCSPNCSSALFTVGVDGSGLRQFADGSFLALAGQ